MKSSPFILDLMDAIEKAERAARDLEGEIVDLTAEIAKRDEKIAELEKENDELSDMLNDR